MKLSTKPNLPILIISIVLLVVVFLPWLSVDMGSDMGTFTQNGLKDWGPLTLAMSILGVGISFVATPKIRSLGTIFIGVLAIAGVAAYWARLQGAGIGYGIVIALIASLGLISAGYLEYRKLEPSGASK